MRLLLLLLLCGITQIGKAQSSFLQKFPNSVYEIAEIADLNDQRLTFEEFLEVQDSLIFSPIKSPNSNLGFTRNNFWVRFQLSNPTDKTLNLFLETGRPITDVVDLFQTKSIDHITHMKSGDLILMQDRPFQHRMIIFPIELSPGETHQFFINYQSDGEVINLPLTLHDASSLIQQSYSDQLVFGAFYGILFLAAITYLFFYFGIRQKSFLLYITYVISVGLLHFALDGYFHQYFTTEITWFSKRAVLLFAAFSALAFGRYVQVYVNLKSFAPFVNRLFQLSLFIMIGLILMVFVWSGGLAYYYPAVNIIALLLIIFSVAAVAMSYIKGKPVDIFFTFGIITLTTGFVIFILNNFSLIPNSFITENITKLSTGLEIIFLSLSMANRIRILKTEKEKIQEMALKQSEESNQIKSFFLSNISHELRTPLNAIIGLSQSIQESTLDQKTKSDLEVIQYSSTNLLSAIDDILDYSKIEKKELYLDQKPFDLQRMIKELRTNTEKQARDKGLKFIYEEINPIPKTVIGDQHRTRQLLQNLLSNALKFTHEGNVELSIRTEEQTDQSFQFHIRISDTGVGIHKEKLDRIFESFVQEELNDKRKFGGFGLGLCIVKALVDQYGGKMEIQSVQGKGTDVLLELTTQVPPLQDPLPQDFKVNGTYDLEGKHLLVVEDNPVNQMVMKAILRKWKNTTFTTALNGLEALDKLKSEKIDLILMDLQMPEMDGYEATQAIRNGACGDEKIDIPIIAVTADTTEKAKIKVIEVGMDDYLTKPVDQEELYFKVKNTLFLKGKDMLEVY